MVSGVRLLGRMTWWKRKPIPYSARELTREGETEQEVVAALAELVAVKQATCEPSPGDPAEMLYLLTVEGKIARRVHQRVYGTQLRGPDDDG